MKTTKENKKKRGPKKGTTNNPNGRPKGVPNKITGTLKEMILGALDNAGGVEYLTRQADENPGAFMTLLGKVLPMTIAGDPQSPVVLKHNLNIAQKVLREMPTEVLQRIMDEHEQAGDNPR